MDSNLLFILHTLTEEATVPKQVNVIIKKKNYFMPKAGHALDKSQVLSNFQNL